MTLLTQAQDSPGMALPDRNILGRRVHGGLWLLLIAVALLSLETGATSTDLGTLWAALSGAAPLSRLDQVILFDIRLPRLALGALVGAGLAVSGAVMQGLFRNPLADPGLVGVGAGAGLGAIGAIVLGGLLPTVILAAAGPYLVALAAFLGAWATVLLLYRVSTSGGRTSVGTMLLAGIALAALAGAASGVLIYMADDQQLRDLTFWGLGSLAGATWTKALAAAPIIIAALIGAPFLARGLNSLALGEAAAHHMGVAVEPLKRGAVLSVAAATGASVAVAGGIGFVGIVVPHLLRLATGPDHRMLLPNAALLGASLLILADLISRTVVAPAELPIGIVTAILGAPVFLWILLKRRGALDL